jgi:hypothetical protein
VVLDVAALGNYLIGFGFLPGHEKDALVLFTTILFIAATVLRGGGALRAGSSKTLAQSDAATRVKKWSMLVVAALFVAAMANYSFHLGLLRGFDRGGAAIGLALLFVVALLVRVRW